ncbi:MAG TPA: TonB family protein [Opitutaceae bacterium]|jgi:TonB family protein|nr:TonB family protein [Opitutaceae bacterium]
MKTSAVLLLAALAATLARGQFPMAAPAVTPIRILHEDLPIFPRDMRAQGIRDGYVVVAFGVTAAGRVDDCLALGYSDQGFAEATLDALRHWTFEPLRIRGQAVASTSQLTFDFETDGTVVVSLSGADIDDLGLLRPRHHSDFRTRELRDLDSIPRPLSARAPVYPAALARRDGSASITVDFFIDPTGAVRLPSVDPSQDQELAALAISALQSWRFEPPLCGRKPVQVRASQVFRFEPPKQGFRTRPPAKPISG